MPAPKRPKLAPEVATESPCRGGRKLELVYEEGENEDGEKGEEGCAIACVAMLAGIGYAEAKAHAPPHWETKGAEIDQIRSELASYGFQCDPKRRIGVNGFARFDFDAVLYSKLGGKWDHVAVWDGCERKLLDPYKPGGTFRCTSYIRVHTKP